MSALRSEGSKQSLEAAAVRDGQAAASEEWAGAGGRDHGFSPKAFRAVPLTSTTYNVFSVGWPKRSLRVFKALQENSNKHSGPLKIEK